MGLEVDVTKLADLNEAWPLASDKRKYGDDHLRIVKVAVKSLLVFPGGLEQIGFPATVNAGKLLKVNTGGTAYDLLAQGAAGGLDADLLDGQEASAFAVAAKGVTNGDTHDHSGGDGAQIDHVNLANKGTNTHAQIDAHIAAGGGFIDRGDPSVNDKVLSDFTIDSAWHDWDLSAIVPAGAKAVLLRFLGMGSVNSNFGLRKNGNASAYNVSWVIAQTTDASIPADMIVALDTGRVIEYFGNPPGGWILIWAVVRGWWF